MALNIEDYLNAYKDFGFIDYKPIDRIQRGTDIPKTHSKFFYQVAFIDDSDRQELLYVIILNHAVGYVQDLDVHICAVQYDNLHLVFCF